MSHLFGDLLSQHLHRRHGLSQAQLAAGIDQAPTVISGMCKGLRLTGPQARERVVAIIGWLITQEVLSSSAEANALLAAAGMAELNARDTVEARLLHKLPAPSPSTIKPAPIIAAPVAPAPRTNLPLATTCLIGREHEIEQIIGMLTLPPQASHRCVTVTGVGGVGKTRLALEAAAHLLDRYAQGVWFIELAPLIEPSMVIQKVAIVLGVREQAAVPLQTTLLQALQSRQLLLLLDNCEHLVEACALLVEALLQTCPAVQVLATSRELLGIAGEQPFRTSTLAVPDAALDVPLEQLEEYAAIRLFLERATTFVPGFRISTEQAPIIAQICRRLDGIPLAIELAAARVKLLPVAQIAEHLDHRFHLLTGGRRTALPRQQTLRALIDWSHTLLAGDEQRVFRRLAVFAGSWTLEAAELVCSGTDVQAPAILDLLAHLVDKSLVVPEEHDGIGRYRFLETIRQYALERLEASGEAEVTRSRHLVWYVQLAEQAEPDLRTARRVPWYEQFELERDNLHAALAWALEHNVEAGLRLVVALYRFWQFHSYSFTIPAWLREALARYGEVANAVRARALIFLGDLEGLALARRLGDKVLLLYALRSFAMAAHYAGDYERAAIWQAEQAELAQEIGSITDRAEAAWEHAMISLGQGHEHEACTRFEAALELAREAGHNEAGSLFFLGVIAFKQGRYDLARVYFTEGLQFRCRERFIGGIAACLEGFARLAVEAGQLERATRLASHAEKLRDEDGSWRSPIFAELYTGALARVHEELSEEAVQAAWQAGRVMTLEQAIAEAFELSATTQFP